MNIESLREYALQKEEVTEGFPFGETTLVFKVKGKVFLLASLDASPLRFNLKCDPDKAIELREEYPENILPGFHMNKTLEHRHRRWRHQRQADKRNGRRKLSTGQ